MNKYKNRIYCIFAIFITVILSSCSGGICPPEGDNTDTQVLNIEMNAPSQYPAGQELYIPVLVTNTNNSTLSNVVYSTPVATNTTGSTISVTDDSQANCGTLTSGQTCQLTVHIVPNQVVTKQNSTTSLQDASSVADNVGSFKVLAQNDKLKAEKSVYIGLVDVPSSSGIGADGIALLYNHTLISGNSCKVNSYTNALITMVVTSENVGQFNTLQIVDTNGNILQYEVLTGNSGQGMTNLIVGSVVTLAIEVPCGSTQLVFKPVLQSDNNEVPNGEGQNQVINVIPPTVNKASLSILPSLVNLNESTPTQVITVVNNGNATASSLSISIGDHVTITNSTCGTNLAANASCNYTVSFDANQPIVGTTTSNVSYNDTQTNNNLNVVVNYRGKTPFVGLTLSSNNFTYIFNATTESPIYASVVTITNAGEVLPLTLANLPTIQYFDISTNAGTENDCTANQTLQPGASCNILVTYNNATALAGIAQMDIGYNYTDIDSSPQIGKTIIDLNYNTVQSLAVLSYGSFAKNKRNNVLLNNNLTSTYGFAGIVNNGVETSRQAITITNLGQVPATAVSVISPEQPYSIIDNGCGASIAQGASCQVIVAFGPVGSSISAGTKVSNLLTNYLSYATAATATSISTQLSGNVYLPNTAILTGAVSASAGFEGGNGSVAQPYQIQRNKINGSVTYTLTNSGETPANEFYVSYNPNVLLPWVVTNNSCGTQQNPIALAESGGSCNITFRPNTTSVGSSSLNLANIEMNWVDEDSPNGQTQAGIGVIYANVFAAPTITTTTVPFPIGTLLQNTNFKVIVTLAGGYNVTPQAINGTISGDINSNMTTSSSSCSVSSANSSCSMTFTVKANPVSESGVLVNLTNATTPQIIPTPNRYRFNVQYNTQPFYVDPISPKIGESFNFTPNFTADQPSVTNPYIVTLPAGITTDNGANSYQMTSSPFTKHLNISPTLSPGLYPITMTDSFGNVFTTLIPISRLANMLYMTNSTGVASCEFNPVAGSIVGSCTANSQINSTQMDAIAINSTGTYAYVGGRESYAAPYNIYYCAINDKPESSNYGKFTACSTITAPGLNLTDWVRSIIVNKDQTKLYISQYNEMFSCNITSTNPVPSSCQLVTPNPFNMSIRNFTLNFNGDQMLAVNEGNTPYLSSCNVSSDGSISTNCSSYSINPYGKYAGVSFSYNNKNIFTVSASSDSSIAYTQYDPTTNTVADNFADGIVNQMPYNSVLQSAYFGPTYVIMSSWENGMFFCTMDIATSKINECNPWADVASFTNIDGIAVFQ